MAAGFLTKIDIANRALQRCGANRITSFDQDAKNAAAVANCYETLREAELRRNTWRFSMRYVCLRPLDEDALNVSAGAYDPAKIYTAGHVVQADGVYYTSLVSVPLARAPADYPDYWRRYFGPGTASLWDDTETYQAGELVYTPQAYATAKVYRSLVNDNTDDPTVVAAYDAATIYYIGDTVTYSAVVYQSTVDINVGNTPTGTAPWVTVASLATQTGRRMGQNWLRLDDMSPYRITTVNPLQSSGSSNPSPRSLFHLPSGFLREVPIDGRGGPTALGGPGGADFSDFEYNQAYVLSRTTGLMVLRFAADVDYVPEMDPMFCEGLAARIAMEICEEVTQSTDKLKALASLYKTFMTEARMVNAIEQGPTEPAEDDFVTVRR